MRCAIYARYSSDQQSPDSIADQVRKCREYADKKGWTVLEHHIYSDAAISGAGSDSRPGLRTMLMAGKKKAFDVLLLDDSSRLSRRMADSMNFVDELKYAEVRVIFVSQGIDSDDEQSDTLTMMHGWKDSLYLKELAKKTRRGMEGRALKGLHTGGRCFGYSIEKLPGENAGARLAVNEPEAKILRRIFELYASGTSLKNIAGILNDDKIPPAQLREGKHIASWCPSAVRAMIRNELYIGRQIWNRSKSVKHPKTGKRTFRKLPSTQWVIMVLPNLRIVSEELWQRVLDRRKTVARLYSKPGAGTREVAGRTGGRLLSGFLTCGFCGGPMIIVGRDKYGCREHWIRKAGCANNLLIRQSDLQSQYFAELQKQVLTSQTIDRILSSFARQVQEVKRGASAEIAGLEQRRSVIEKELANLTNAVALTGGSTAVMEQIVKRERERGQISSKLAAIGKGAFEDRVDDLRKFVTSRLSSIQTLLADNPAQAKLELARHATPLVMTPTPQGYEVKGEWDVIGSVDGVPTMSTRGIAGGRNASCRPIRFIAKMAKMAA